MKKILRSEIDSLLKSTSNHDFRKFSFVKKTLLTKLRFFQHLLCFNARAKLKFYHSRKRYHRSFKLLSLSLILLMQFLDSFVRRFGNRRSSREFSDKKQSDNNLKKCNLIFFNQKMSQNNPQNGEVHFSTMLIFRLCCNFLKFYR